MRAQEVALDKGKWIAASGLVCDPDCEGQRGVGGSIPSARVVSDQGGEHLLWTGGNGGIFTRQVLKTITTNASPVVVCGPPISSSFEVVAVGGSVVVAFSLLEFCFGLREKTKGLCRKAGTSQATLHYTGV